jgi:cyclase
MLRKRIIPCLLLKGKGFVKTTNFKNPVYLGDPQNIINIFNQKMIDEIMILDISASFEKRHPNFDLIQKLSSRSFSPMCIGGGINSISDAEKLFNIGIEKVCLNTVAFENPTFLSDLVSRFGSQSIVVSINVSKNLFGRYQIVDNSIKSLDIKLTVIESIKWFENLGVGEILINDVANDGVMKGYDVQLLKTITSVSSIPIIASGGCGSLEHIKEAFNEGGVSAAAVGSFFVFNGKHKAVLISYPSNSTVKNLISNNK